MIKTYYLGSVFILFLLIAAGCGISDPVTNSAGPSATNAILSLEANPPSIPAGGNGLIIVTLKDADSGAPIVGGIVDATSSSGTVTSPGTMDSFGRAVFAITSIAEPTTFTFCYEDICASIRVNTNPVKE